MTIRLIILFVLWPGFAMADNLSQTADRIRAILTNDDEYAVEQVCTADQCTLTISRR